MKNDINDMRKTFNQWNMVKINLNDFGRRPKISEGQIWWTGIGKNIGSELDGKNDRFSRPVIIYRKLCKDKFMAIPLTSKMHIGSWYVHFVQNGINENAVVCDAKVMSTKRLYRKIGEIDDEDFERVRKGFIDLYG